ncbi:hypothetical protein [Lacihabitans soyangensis]|uniref:Lipocalin-like domain-containing protein n=1 Tax=Lacihabitans soyangensis TaxID=869394 RepID=A0AAE3H5T7_9BACT|nr:hypothetical protein [Lacihabitans soyangensis]MCP9764536.1 hypothetical protein [Lacihabitans soyangensis]
MKKVLIIAIVVFISLACKEDKVEPTNLSQSELLSLNSWQLSRYINTSGKTLSNSELNISAVALYGLQFEFRADKETRAVDKITKTILNRGTWDLISGETVLDINITSFKGQFKIVTLSKGKLTLQASTGNFLSGVGSEINMEFTESKN